MRKLFVLRGVMGAGKSTFIRENNLENYTLNADTIRLMFNAPEMTINCNEKIPQFNNVKVWKLLFEILEERMKKGELTFIDAMNIYRDDLSQYRKLAEKYRYRLYIIDFSDLSFEELLIRNSKRNVEKRVSENTIKRCYKAVKEEKTHKVFTIIKPSEFYKVINVEPRNVDMYEKVHIFGDIHGCYSPLEEYFNNNKIQDNELYVFTGDYFDRGFENLKIFEFVKNHINDKNFIFLIGNHEDRLYKYACDDEYKLDYDLKTTISQIEGNVKKSELRGVIKNLNQIANIEFSGNRYIINHGGIPYYPEKSLDFYSTNSFIYGVDKYEVNIDKIYNDFMKSQKNKVYQVHGHRNYYNIDYNKYEYSYNLDGNIENGGYLRVLILGKDGSVNLTEIKNNKYDPNLLEKQNVYSLLEKMRSDNYILERKLYNNISSFNFSKKAFYDSIWNSMTIKARGLFVDTENYLVVARSYNKFFNFDERYETKYELLKEKLNYPVRFYLKYNGFLGILSVYNGELIFGTKSQLSGDFNEYFKNIFYNKYNTEQVDKIRERLIKNNSSMVFEVMDCVNDKHIIEYNDDDLVLLDEIYNVVDYSKENYDELKTFTDENNIRIKELAYTVYNIEEFEELVGIIKHPQYKYNNEYVEGFVIEDKIGFMFKYKTEYYKKWKILRSRMEYAIKNNDFKAKDNRDVEFMDFLERKYKDKNINVNLVNIVNERTDFEESVEK